MNKYKNKKYTFGAIVFDSKKEGNRYKELLLLEQAGEISNLRRQVKFVLIPAHYEEVKRFGKNGQQLKSQQRCIERECAYIADFVYIDKDGKKVVEDTKGMKTKDYIIKRKLMLHVHGIRIKEV